MKRSLLGAGFLARRDWRGCQRLFKRLAQLEGVELTRVLSVLMVHALWVAIHIECWSSFSFISHTT
eukprot:2951862-Amphidinium_carterae.2